MSQRSSAACGGAQAKVFFDGGSDDADVCNERRKIGRGSGQDIAMAELGRAIMLRSIADRILVR
jgi:hypothetical protein